MKISVILAHPDRGSFNHAIAKTAVEALHRAGHTVSFHDLYEERFDPVLPAVEIPAGATLPLPIAAHCLEIAEAEGIVIVHPNWWGQPPAILKGWIDRVIRSGVAYNFLEGDSGAGVPVGLLRAKTAIVFNTSNTPAEREEAAFGDPLELIWRHCVFGLCGMDDVRREVFGVVVTSTEEQRNLWLDRVRGLVAVCFPATAACVKE
jgi:NAD(P)H dehydrogenase (quinone)